MREFFTHVRFHKHDEEQIVIHLLVELYARSAQEATDVLEEAAHGQLEITSLAEESRPPAHAPMKRTSHPHRRGSAAGSVSAATSARSRGRPRASFIWIKSSSPTTRTTISPSCTRRARLLNSA